MYQDVVYHKIAKSVKCNAQTNEKQVVKMSCRAKVKKHDTGDGKYDKKNVVSFKNIGVFGLMMVGMKVPH
jgi:hypothetical protein